MARVVLEADAASNREARHVLRDVGELVGVERALGVQGEAVSHLHEERIKKQKKHRRRRKGVETPVHGLGKREVHFTLRVAQWKR